MTLNLSIDTKPTYTLVQEQEDNHGDINTVLYKNGRFVSILYWISAKDGRLHLLSLCDGEKALVACKKAGISLRKTGEGVYVVDVANEGLTEDSPLKDEDNFKTYRVPRIKKGDEAMHAEVYVGNQDAELRKAAHTILTGFSWDTTPEGFDYWHDVVTRLKSLSKYGKTED